MPSIPVRPCHALNAWTGDRPFGFRPNVLPKGSAPALIMSMKVITSPLNPFSRGVPAFHGFFWNPAGAFPLLAHISPGAAEVIGGFCDAEVVYGEGLLHRLVAKHPRIPLCAGDHVVVGDVPGLRPALALHPQRVL